MLGWPRDTPCPVDLGGGGGGGHFPFLQRILLN